MMLRTTLLFLVVQLLLSLAMAVNLDIGWSLPPNGQPFEDQKLSVGDSISFTWVGGNFHNAYYHPNDDCGIDNTHVLIGKSSPATYTFTQDDVGKKMLFVCEVNAHCEYGQQISVSVSAAGGPVSYDLPADGPTAAPVSWAYQSKSSILCLVLMAALPIMMALFY